jgi:GNAT superfamily N-acetyltransferase
MLEVRLAQKGDIVRQKEIWKLCFGDSDRYIDFYYSNRYQETETVLLLEDQEICSMLTMLPIRILAPTKQTFKAAMLYAIATHPQHQNRGFASQVIDFTHQSLKEEKKSFSVLVPAEKHLINFYRKRGYQDGFCIREAVFTQEGIEGLNCHDHNRCILSKIRAEDYNLRRNEHLSGRLYVAFNDNEIAYQQKLSQLSGADIFGIEINGAQGCAALERLNPGRILIRELLIPDQYLQAVLKNIAALLPAPEYVLRTPAFLGQQMKGNVRPFGMIKKIQERELEVTAEELGYLGLAFD